MCEKFTGLAKIIGKLRIWKCLDDFFFKWTCAMFFNRQKMIVICFMLSRRGEARCNYVKMKQAQGLCNLSGENGDYVITF